MKMTRPTLAAMLIAAFIGTGTGPAGALECGYFNRDDCDEVCGGKRYYGCRSCGFLCEECDCAPPLPPEKVCCHVKGADCNTEIVPDAAAWMSAEECERTWGGVGEKTCPPEACGPRQ